MSERIAYAMQAAILSLACVGPAHAQHDFERTITVDPSGNADQTTIQGGIDDSRIGDDPSDRYTVLIYAGTYNENVTLPGTKENVDLVGVDRDGVIIAPSSGDGIVITSGTETSRNNSIRNLTINTTTGIGIKIVKGGTPVPKNIVIDGVTIDAVGTDMDGIHAIDVEQLRVSNVSIQTTDGHGIALTGPTESEPKPKKLAVVRTIVNRDSATKARDPTVENSVHPSSSGIVHIINCHVTSLNGHAVHFADNFKIADSQTTEKGSPRTWTQNTGPREVWIPYCKITDR